MPGPDAQMQVKFEDLRLDERLILGDEVAATLIACTLPPVQSALAEVTDPSGERMLALNLIVVFPPDIIRLPRIVVTAGPGGEPAVDPRIAKAFASVAVRVVLERAVLSERAQQRLRPRMPGSWPTPAPRTEKG